MNLSYIHACSMHINIQIYVLMCLHQCMIVSMHTHVDNMHICVYVNTANTCPQSYTYKNIYFNFFHVCVSATWGKCLQRPEEGVISLELELQRVMSHPM